MQVWIWVLSIQFTTESPSTPPRRLGPPRECPLCLRMTAGSHTLTSQGHVRPPAPHLEPHGRPLLAPLRTSRSARSACSPCSPSPPRSWGRPAPCTQWALAQCLLDRGGFLRDKPHLGPVPSPMGQRQTPPERAHTKVSLWMAGYAFLSLAWYSFPAMGMDDFCNKLE